MGAVAATFATESNVTKSALTSPTFPPLARDLSAVIMPAHQKGIPGTLWFKELNVQNFHPVQSRRVFFVRHGKWAHVFKYDLLSICGHWRICFTGNLSCDIVLDVWDSWWQRLIFIERERTSGSPPKQPRGHFHFLCCVSV